MAYSKFLRQSKYLIGHSFKNVEFSHRNRVSYLLNKHSKVFPGANFYFINCHFSTVLQSKFYDLPKSTSKHIPSLNFTALLSTDGNAESYKVVITNPTEGTSTTLSSSLSSVDEIKNIGETPVSSNFTDIATSFSEEISTVADVVEPSLTSLGLCNWTPVGLVQSMLEYMHLSYHWPWWITIVVTTVIARLLLFPVLLKTQKNAINMSNYMPQLQYLQLKFGEARRTGNSLEASKIAHEMMVYMKQNNISPLKNAMFPLIQAPVFISFFLALRSMARLPVESMKDGGIGWVSDLTIPDPYYVLPLAASATLYVVLKVGAESGVKMENLKMAKYFVQALPVLALPFSIYFPSAVLYYWCTNNFCTLLIVSFLKIQPVRDYFKLPTQQPIDPKFKPPKKGFVQGVKEAFEDQKVLSLIDERRRMDEIRWQKSGTGPIPRTYSYDPTKPRPSNAASIVNKTIAAKDRKV